MKRSIIKITLLTLTALQPAILFAETKPSAPALQPALVHTAPKSSELPFPGKPLTLSVRIENSRSFDLRIRLLAVRDGVLQDIPVGNPSYDKSEKIVYSASLPSPLESISYQFMLYGEGQKVNVTSRYSITRSCVPDVSLTSLEAEPAENSNPIEESVNRAEGLKRDIQEYEEAVALLDSLHGALK